MMSALRLAPVALLLACRSRPDPNAVTASPAPLPLPAPTASVTPRAQPSAAPSAPKRVCEPTIACGRWSRCEWLELDHVEAGGRAVYRVEGSDAGGWGSHFWRMHDCYPEDAGPSGCSLYCATKGSCVDAFQPDGVCTVSGPPTPSPWVCEVHGEECATRPAP